MPTRVRKLQLLKQQVRRGGDYAERLMIKSDGTVKKKQAKGASESERASEREKGRDREIERQRARARERVRSLETIPHKGDSEREITTNDTP